MKDAISVELSGSIEFVNSEVLEDGLENAGLPQNEIDAIVNSYESGQLTALRIGLFAAGVVVVIALFLVRRIPDHSFEEMVALEARKEEEEEEEAGAG